MFFAKSWTETNCSFATDGAWTCSLLSSCFIYPTNRFTILEPRDQEINEFYFVQERRATDFEAPKLRKGSFGNKGQEERRGALKMRVFREK